MTHIVKRTLLVAITATLAFSGAVSAKPNKELPLTSAVKWQRISKEYKLITTSLYHNAADALTNREINAENWVVVMDVDETLLDNSEFQRRLDTSGGKYTSEGWANWVKEENADAVPGAVTFVKAFLAKGGKLAAITNRPQALDSHTWANLKAVGFPVTQDNTCLMGRSKEDKAAINHNDIINDKDRRRAMIEAGKAECFEANTPVPSVWRKPAVIEMQVGDNIEDVRFVTQEDADIEALLPRQGHNILILPNPMYGSW